MRLATDFFVWTALLVLSKGLIPTLLTGGGGTVVSNEQGLLEYQILAGAVYAVVLAVAIAHPARFITIGKRLPLVCALCLWAFCSVAWSTNPGVSLRRAVAVCGTTGLGFYIAAFVPLERLRRYLESLILFSVVAGILFVYLTPYGVHSDIHDGSWRGIFMHKNACGQFMTLGLVVLISGVLDVHSGRIARTALAFACVAFLVATGSRTAWLGAPIVVGVVLLMRARTSVWTLVAVSVACGAVVSYYQGSLGNLLDGIGRDTTLTGRLPLWDTVVADARLHPLLGFGYGAYWLGLSGTGASAWSAMGWLEAPTHAHNALLDVIIELGVTGGIIFVLGVGAGALRLWTVRRHPNIPRWLAGVFLAVVLFGITGGDMFVQNSLYWVLFVATIANASAVRTTQAHVRRPLQCTAASAAATPRVHPVAC